MSLLILRTGLAGVPGDAVGGGPGGVGGDQVSSMSW
jgi:hypothetical protein